MLRSGGGLTATGGQLFTQVGAAVEQGDGPGPRWRPGQLQRRRLRRSGRRGAGRGGGARRYAGALSVLYGSAGGLSAAAGGCSPRSAGRWSSRTCSAGAPLAAGNFDGDAFDDLAAGAPGETVGAEPLAGAVSVIRGSGSGLTTAAAAVHPGGRAVEADDQFGAEVGTGDFDNDDFVDLAVGALAEDVSGAFNAGAVSALYGAAGGLLHRRRAAVHPEQPRRPGRRRGRRLFGGNFLSAGRPDMDG